jgi:phage-related protein
MANRTQTIKAVVLGDVDDFKQGMADVGNSAQEAGGKVKRDLGDSFDSLGEGAGNAEGKFIGLADTIGGTADVMEGFRTGNVQQMAMGFADLAGAAEQLWAGFGKVITQTWAKITATGADTAATATNTTATIGARIASFAAAAAAKAQAAAQWLLNAAMSANPIGLVVIAIAALTAAFVIAWKNSETFRNIVTGAMDAVKGAAMAVWDWISEWFPKLFDIMIAPYVMAWNTIQWVWNAIKDGALGVYNWTEEKFNALVGFVKGLPGQVWDATTGMFDGIKDAFRSAINWIIGKWNGLELHLPSIDTKIPGVGKVGGFTLGTKDINYFANGGLVKGGHGGVLGMIGEGRSDELIVPLDRAGNNGLGNTYNIVLHASPVASARDIGRELQRCLGEFARAT